MFVLSIFSRGACQFFGGMIFSFTSDKKRINPEIDEEAKRGRRASDIWVKNSELGKNPEMAKFQV